MPYASTVEWVMSKLPEFRHTFLGKALRRPYGYPQGYDISDLRGLRLDSPLLRRSAAPQLRDARRVAACEEAISCGIKVPPLKLSLHS